MQIEDSSTSRIKTNDAKQVTSRNNTEDVQAEHINRIVGWKCLRHANIGESTAEDDTIEMKLGQEHEATGAYRRMMTASLQNAVEKMIKTSKQKRGVSGVFDTSQIENACRDENTEERDEHIYECCGCCEGEGCDICLITVAVDD